MSAYLFVALTLLAAVFWLGSFVITHAEPPVLMAIAHVLRGKGVPMAWALTQAGYGYVLGPIYAVVVFAGLRRPRLRAGIYAVACGLVAWGAAAGLQHLFQRPRRPDWIVRHETAFSYPSSHAAIATAFYFICGLLILRSSAPGIVRYGAFGLLTVLALGIAWSRLALAAHYPTDVIGGIVLGLAVATLLRPSTPLRHALRAARDFGAARSTQDDKGR